MPGDFKINLPYARLVTGTNTVIITAIDSAGATKIDTVTVNRRAGTVWPLPYSVSWSGPNSLTDSAQVVDGKWERVAQWSPQDPTGVELVGSVRLTPDSSVIGYGFIRQLSDLYLVRNLR
jgi:hypothetical protein